MNNIIYREIKKAISNNYKPLENRSFLTNGVILYKRGFSVKIVTVRKKIKITHLDTKGHFHNDSGPAIICYHESGPMIYQSYFKSGLPVNGDEGFRHAEYDKNGNLTYVINNAD